MSLDDLLVSLFQNRRDYLCEVYNNYYLKIRMY